MRDRNVLKVLHVVGARPNFMKAAPVMDAMAKRTDFRQQLLHTGQHYDANMSQVFFTELGLPQPDTNLGIGSGTHAWQTASIMIEFEKAALADRPDLVLVYGDVNSTMAATIVCAKLGIAVGHVEAGLRSFDRSMPEEINRLVTDQLADLLFTPSIDGNQNLEKEGVSPEKIFLVGNVMIDTLVRLLPQAQRRTAKLGRRFNLEKRFGLVTLHRPSNVDSDRSLEAILDALNDISRSLPLVFPVHPRTKQQMASAGLLPDGNALQLVEPLGYLDFLALMQAASLVITDSGGIQEETTFLGVPCLTLRENTERPVTVTDGTNLLIGHDLDRLRQEVGKILDGEAKKGSIPPLWDGKAGERIAGVLQEKFLAVSL